MEAGGSFEDKDATRRTQLAGERTFLSWWRSGLTALGVSLAIARVVPALGHQTRWPYAAVGALYALFGLGMMVYGAMRQRDLEQGIERGEFIAAERRLVGVFTLMAIAIGLGTLALVLVHA